MGKDFRPGLVAGLVLGAFSAYALLIRLPRASREIATLRGADKQSAVRKDSKQ
jgi:hypothetical protein